MKGMSGTSSVTKTKNTQLEHGLTEPPLPVSGRQQEGIRPCFQRI